MCSAWCCSRSFAAVLSTDAWIAVLASGVPPERDTIAGSNQRARLRRLARGGRAGWDVAEKQRLTAGVPQQVQRSPFGAA